METNLLIPQSKTSSFLNHGYPAQHRILSIIHFEYSLPKTAFEFLNKDRALTNPIYNNTTKLETN